MPINLFISYDHEDQEYVASFRSLALNPNNPLQFSDRSLVKPVLNHLGQVISALPTDPNARAVCVEIEKLLLKASHLVVLVGKKTHNSAWVQWEVNRFKAIKHGVMSEQTSRRVIGMKLKGQDDVPVPSFLTGNYSSGIIHWDIGVFTDWLNKPLE